jgi:hypothetical protein
MAKNMLSVNTVKIPAGNFVPGTRLSRQRTPVATINNVESPAAIVGPA